MHRFGFSLAEIILVVGIVGVMAGVSVPIYRDYQIKSDLNLATEQVAQGIERARLMAQSGAQDSAWGFYVPEGVLYKGESYFQEGRDASFDETYSMPSTIKVHGLYEVSYSQSAGSPSNMGQIKLTTINDEERTVLIEVQEESIVVVTADPIVICVGTETLAVSESEAGALLDAGNATLGACIVAEASAGSSASAPSVASASSASVEVEGEEEFAACDGGKTAVCHVTPGWPVNRHSLCVETAAWPAHRAHGDTVGACVVETDEPLPSPACENRFTIADDNVITTTGTIAMTVRVLGSDITFGAAGPEIKVDLSYQVNDGSWRRLFNGRDVDGGETAVVTDLSTGSRIAMRAHGQYKEHNWLRFNESFSTNDETGHFSVFRNGAPLPNFPIFGEQQSIASFLGEYLSEDGTVAIGPYDVLLLGELGTSLSGESADFQDIVVLLQFGAPDCD